MHADSGASTNTSVVNSQKGYNTGAVNQCLHANTQEGCCLDIDVKLLRINSGTPDEFIAVKTVINIKQIAKCLNGNQLIEFVKYITEGQIATLDRFSGGKEIYKPYIRIGDLLIFPRFMYQKMEEYCNNRNIKYKINHKSHKPISEYEKCIRSKFGNIKIGIFPDKLTVIDMIIEDLKVNKGLIVKLDTGKGKSVIITEVTRRLNLMTNIVTKDSTLQRQMFEELHTNMDLDCAADCVNCLTESGASKCKYIALLGGTKSRSNTNLVQLGEYKILISIINSASRMSSDYWKSFGLSIFDECHAYTADEWSKIFDNCQTPYMLGTSATPERKWNSILIEHNIGHVVDFDPYIQSNGVIKGTVYKISYKGPPEHTAKICNKKGIVSVAKMVKQFMGDPERNKILIEAIIEAVQNHKHGFVFAMRNDFLFMLKDMLDTESAIRNLGIISVVLCSGISNEDKKIAKTTANVIFTNYAFSEGVNIVHTRFEVLASPYKENGKQITGRVMRKNYEDERYFYDLIDANTTLRSQYKERKANYDRRGFKIKKYQLSEVDQPGEVDAPELANSTRL